MNAVEVENLKVSFYSPKSNSFVHAVDDVSFTLGENEFLGLVGESGCGKSTIARMLMGLQIPDGGTIRIKGKEIKPPYPHSMYKQVQMIYQMPQDSFDPRRKVGTCITEIQSNFGVNKREARDFTMHLLTRVGLTEEYYNKYPHEMSGGECQRAAIARSLSLKPDILICDEPTSALDVSVQAQVVELLAQLRKEMKLGVLFISHDLALVQGLCDSVMVMYQGKIVERGSAKEITQNPREDYTRKLLSSVLLV